MGVVCNFKMVDRMEVLAEKMTFEQRVERREGEPPGGLRKDVQQRGR